MPILKSERFAYFRHPQKYFLQHGLNIRFAQIKGEEPEREPFDLEDSYRINHQWIEAKLHGRNLSLEKLKAQGRWLSGELGKVAFEKKEQEIDQFVEKIHAKEAGTALDPLAIDLNMGSVRLVGSLANTYSHASLFYRYAPIKGKDFVIAWLQHLIINREREHITHLVSQDDFISFLPEHIQGNELEQFIAYYQAGGNQPEAFFTEAAFSYAKQQANLNKPNARSSKSAIEAAKETLNKSLEQSYEPELKLLYKNLADVDTLLNADFEHYSNTLLLAAWEATHDL